MHAVFLVALFGTGDAHTPDKYLPRQPANKLTGMVNVPTQGEAWQWACYSLRTECLLPPSARRF